MMTCLRWILGFMRLEIWCKIGLSADWCLCTVLRTRSGVCYCWIGASVSRPWTLLNKLLWFMLSLCQCVNLNQYSPYNNCIHIALLPSVVWCCWLGGRKGIRPVKNWVVVCWRGYLSGAKCRLAYGPADATATYCLLLQKNPYWFYLSDTGSPGLSRKNSH